VRGISTNAARIVGCMRMERVRSRATSAARVPGQYGFKLYNEEKISHLSFEKHERQG
jgi:hypothetical protein